VAGAHSAIAREKRERNRSVEPVAMPSGSSGSPMPPTISPRSDCEK
jgi:hypothetical protein